jgi:protocatechuate 3,4-dioxygenase beta subunit
MSSQVGMLGRSAQTDAEGRAAPGPVVPGPWVLRADADGYLSSESVLLTIDEAGVPEQTLVLSLPGRIEGIVVDADGRPVPGAFVSVSTDALWTVGESEARADTFRSSLVAAGTLGVTKGPVPEVPIWGRDDPEPVGNARADDDGRFALHGLMPGEYTLQALHGDFAASEEVTVRVRAGSAHTGIVLVLRTGVPLTGRVVDGNGRPVGNASVELDDGSSYVTDRRGTFHAGLRRGRQVLVARARGLAPARLEVRMPDTALDVELVLGEADARLHGRVEDGNGQPIENAQVTVHMTDGLFATRVDWTDARGLWAIDGLPPGEAELDVEHGDYLPVTHDVVASAHPDTVDVVLEDGWSVEIDVRHFGTDEPVAGASVTGGGLHARTNREGLAKLGPLAGDRVTLRIEAELFPPKTVRVQRPAGAVAEVAVDLVEGGSLAGTVTDYRGDPVPGSRVVVHDADTDEVLADVHAGAGGRFRVDGIPEGDLVLEAFPPPSREDDLAEVAQSSDVLRGRVTDGVELRFDRR